MPSHNIQQGEKYDQGLFLSTFIFQEVGCSGWYCMGKKNKKYSVSMSVNYTARSGETVPQKTMFVLIRPRSILSHQLKNMTLLIRTVFWNSACLIGWIKILQNYSNKNTLLYNLVLMAQQELYFHCTFFFVFFFFCQSFNISECLIQYFPCCFLLTLVFYLLFPHLPLHCLLLPKYLVGL